MSSKAGRKWGYENDNGPHTWSKQFPKAAGAFQSPINISSRAAVFTAKLSNPPLLFGYHQPLIACSLTNTGHSFQIAPCDDVAYITGGPLASKYQFAQLHMHWGRCSTWGSEHALDGRLFAAELHLVHWCAAKFANVQEAAAIKDGLSVLGIFVQVGEPHPELQKIIDRFTDIANPGAKTQMSIDIELAALLPSNTSDFFHYEGSLTTPPCFESVQWIVFSQPITMSEQQLNSLRSLNCADSGKMADNFRPLVPLGRRRLLASFQPNDSASARD